MSGVHLNGALLGVIDTETTGPRPGYHDLIEIAVIILGPDLKPAQNIMPFSMEIQPRRIENIDLEALRVQGKDMQTVEKENICKDRKRVVNIATHGCDPDLAADLFGNWFNNLNLAPNKKIMPIAHNWPFDRAFIQDWLGNTGFEFYFDPRFRDTMAMALYDNDISDWRSEPFEYPKVNLSYLCSQLKIEKPRIHTALDDAKATADVYRRLVSRTQIRTLPKVPDYTKLSRVQLQEMKIEVEKALNAGA